MFWRLFLGMWGTFAPIHTHYVAPASDPVVYFQVGRVDNHYLCASTDLRDMPRSVEGFTSRQACVLGWWR